jgi:hypothetical protein
MPAALPLACLTTQARSSAEPLVPDAILAEPAHHGLAGQGAINRPGPPAEAVQGRAAARRAVCGGSARRGGCDVIRIRIDGE